MNEDIFWDLIEKSRKAARTGDINGSQNRQVAKLEQLLSKLEPGDIARFRDYLHHFMGKANSWDLWGVAEILGEGASDDWFANFRAWLVSMGREEYEKALKDPESVDEIRRLPNVEDIFFEQLLYAPGNAYRAKTGKEPPDVRKLDPKMKSAPSGKRWSTVQDLEKRLPRLYAKYVED